ncbi:PilZ domain-containing protein [Sphingomonas sp. BK235]|uniref:PilZ domain-containing protein n=1 Tax=Sphingomonas sp. BK235 TaxID=2512131 RepID=UPI0010453CA2|nr:PilZ domain-containing protein [Sphingomonas sp. BK235]TCP34074.1 PilZ domain-containing protein [Sphingomonas sp. BK235]
MLLQAVLLPETDDDRRGAERQPVNQPSTLRGDRVGARDVYVRDLSETGFSVTTDTRLTLGSTVTIGLAGHGRATARVVRQVPGGYGCEFLSPITAGTVTGAFRTDTVIQLTSSEPVELPFADPAIERYPGAVRVGVIVGGAALLWGGIIWGVVALL